MKLPQSVHNRISYTGVVIVALASIVFMFLLILSAVREAGPAPYESLVIFVLVPAVLFFGLLLIPVGMGFERHRVRRTGLPSMPRFPVVDLNDPQQRRVMAFLAAAAFLLLFFSVFGSYQAYEATESIAFCGATCHTPMQPEYVTHQDSPHARVKCVACHVGPGAGSYVKAKLNGLPQLYEVALDTYPRPIPAPISILRPARYVCEQCHWPGLFFSAELKHLTHFLPDEHNTRWQIDLLVKVGGGRQMKGSHWHVQRGTRLEYIAADSGRQQIPWVRVTEGSTGRVTEYQSTANPLSPAERTTATIRTMDCIDCHNRPTHIFPSPAQSVNQALAAGRMDSTLPFLRKTAVELLSARYRSTDAALRRIAEGLVGFYRKQYPQLADARHDAIRVAVVELHSIYQHTMFPAMKARWDTYPDNIGHLMSPGCFRCHDGQHKSADGKMIKHECTTCHTITAQGKAGAISYAPNLQGLGFQHPSDIGEIWQQLPCNTCHTGANP